MIPYTMYIDTSQPTAWQTDVFSGIGHYLQEKGIALCIQEIETFLARPYLVLKRAIQLDQTMAVIQNNRLGTYYVLEGHDWVTPFNERLKNIAFDPRCRMVLKCQYRKQPYAHYPYTKIKPWTYFETHPHIAQAMVGTFRQSERTLARMFFRGETTRENRGPIMERLAAKNIVNLDYPQGVEYTSYLAESAQYKLVLALPGMGNICHREIEAFGVGTPTLMPRLKNTLRHDLIPDYHYISVTVDTLQDSADDVANQIEQRFQQVIHDQSYLDFIANNALQWYESNVRFSNCFALTAKALGFF